MSKENMKADDRKGTQPSQQKQSETKHQASVPLPEYDIPMHVVFRNLLKLHQSKQSNRSNTFDAKQSTKAQTSAGSNQFNQISPAKNVNQEQDSIHSNQAANTQNHKYKASQSLSNNRRNVLASREENRADPRGEQNRNLQQDSNLCLADSHKYNQIKPIRNHKERSNVVGLIQQINKSFLQSRKTSHLAIAYADYLIAQDGIFDISFNAYYLKKAKMRPHLLAAVCVLMASKYYEIDDNLISISDLQQFLKTSKKIERHYHLSFNEVTKAELVLLDKLNWDLNFILPLDFCQVYLQILKKQIGLQDDDGDEKHYEQLENKVEENLDQLMAAYDQFLEYPLPDVAFCLVQETLNQFLERHGQFQNDLDTDEFAQSVIDLLAGGSLASREDQNPDDEALRGKRESLKGVSFKIQKLLSQEGDALSDNQENTYKRVKTVPAASASKDSVLRAGTLQLESQKTVKYSSKAAAMSQTKTNDDKTQKSQLEQQSFQLEDEECQKFNENKNYNSKSIVTLTEAISSFKKSISGSSYKQKKLFDAQGGRMSSQNQYPQVQPISDIKSNSSSFIGSMRRGSFSQMTQMTKEPAASKVDKLTQKIKQNGNNQRAKIKPFTAHSQCSDIKDISPLIYKEEQPGSDIKKPITKFVELDENFKEVKDEYSHQSPIELEEDMQFELKSSKIMKISPPRQSVDQISNLNQSPIQKSDNESSYSKNKCTKQHYLSKRLQSKIQQLNLRRGYLYNDNEQDKTDNSKETNSRTKYAPLKKYYERTASNNAQEKQMHHSHKVRSEKEDVSEVTKQRNEMQSNCEQSSYAQNKMIDSHRSGAQDTSKFYTFSKEMNFDSGKNEKAENRYNNLREFKKNNCQQRNLTQRLDSKVRKDTSRDLASSKYNFKSRISPPSQLISLTSADNGLIDAIKQKNESLFKQVQAINPEAMRTFCEDLNLDQQLNVANQKAGTQNPSAASSKNGSRFECNLNKKEGGASKSKLISRSESNSQIQKEAPKKLRTQTSMKKSNGGDVQCYQTKKVERTKDLPLAEKNNEVAKADDNFKSRCQSTRQTGRIASTTQKCRAFRNINSVLSTNQRQKSNIVSTVSKISPCKISGNDSECNNLTAQQSKVSSPNNFQKQTPHVKIGFNKNIQAYQKRKSSTEEQENLEQDINSEYQQRTTHKRIQGTQNQLLFKSTNRKYLQLTNGSRNESESSAKFLKSNPSYQQFGSVDKLHSHERANKDRVIREDERYAKKTGTVLGIRNQNQTDRAKQLCKQYETKQQGGKKIGQQTGLDRFGQKSLVANNSTNRIMTKSSQKQITKCKSIYFEKNKQLQTVQTSQQQVSLKLLQNISNALSCEKLPVADQYTKVSDNKAASKKSRIFQATKGTSQLKRFQKGEQEQTSPQVNKYYEKRGSYQFQQTQETMSRVKNQGSFSLCMSNINTKVKAFENQQLIEQIDIEDENGMHVKKIEIQAQIRKSDSQRQLSNSRLQKRNIAQETYLKTTQTAFDHSKDSNTNCSKSHKKDHYLKILRAHNESQNQTQKTSESTALQRVPFDTTSSTTPCVDAQFNSKSNCSRLNKFGNGGRRNSNQDHKLSQLHSPKSINPLDSSKASGVTMDRDKLLKKYSGVEVQQGFFNRLSKNDSSRKLRSQKKYQSIKNEPEEEILIDNANEKSQSNECDHYFVITQFESHRSRTKNLGSKQAANTVGSLQSYRTNTCVPSPAYKKNCMVQKNNLSVNTKRALHPQANQSGTNATSERQHIITPKQKTLYKAKFADASDGKCLKSNNGSSKNLHPRCFKNKYESSQKKGENLKKRVGASSIACKESPPTRNVHAKKMVVFSPSLDKGRKVIKYTNPFQNVSNQKVGSCQSRGNLSEASNAADQHKKYSNENTISATKLMSFVERRQIYLNSNSTKVEKRKCSNTVAESEQRNYSSSEIKSTLRKFNLQSAEKLPIQVEKVKVDQMITPRQKIANQIQKSDKKPCATQQVSSSRKPPSNENQCALLPASQKIEQARIGSTTIQKAQLLSLQFENQTCSTDNKSASDRNPNRIQNPELQDVDFDKAAPAYSSNENQQNRGRLLRRQQLKNSMQPVQYLNQTDKSVPRQVHAPSQSCMIQKGNQLSKTCQSLMESTRHKTNYSELKVKTSLIDMNFEAMKGNAMDSTEICKLNETQKTARTIHQQSSCTRSPIQSRQSLIPSTCESINQNPIKKKDKANVGLRPSIILEASDQCEHEAAPSNFEHNKVLFSGEPINVKSQDFQNKYMRTIISQNKTDLSLTCRLKSESTWQSFSFNPKQMDTSSNERKTWAQNEMESNKNTQHTNPNMQSCQKTKKQRRTAQERKYQKRIPQHA